MAEANETMELNWEEYDSVEDISDADQKQSEDLSRKLLVGKFLCTVVDISLREASYFNGLQVNLKMRIDHVLEFNREVRDKNGKVVMRKAPDGEEAPLEKKMPISETEQEETNAMLSGLYLFDDINYPAEGEDQKGTHKRRRLFVAKKMGLITNKATQMSMKDWQKVLDSQVVVESEKNRYLSKGSGEYVTNHQVMFNGYSTLAANGLDPEAFANNDDDYSDI